MTPRNPIADELLRQELTDLQAMPPAERVAWLEGQYNKILQSILSRLLPFAAKAMGITVTALKGRVPCIRVMFLPSVNACRDPVSGRIEVYIGLMTFFHTIITALVARLGLGTLDGRGTKRVVHEPTVPFETTCTLADRVMTDFYQEKLCAGRPEGTLLTYLADHQLLFWRSFLDYSEAFVVAHELGHVALSLCPEKTDIDIALVASQQLLASQEGLSDDQRQERVEQWPDEIAADLFALRLLPGIGEDNLQRMLPGIGGDNLQRILAYSAAELTFIMMNMLEEFGKRRMGQKPPTAEHPPALVRLALLRLATVGSNPPEIFQIGQALYQQSENILGAICPLSEGAVQDRLA